MGNDDIVRDKDNLQKFVSELLRLPLDEDHLREYYTRLRAVYSNCLFYKLEYMKLVKEEKKKTEESFASTTERMIIKGFTQGERDIMRNIAGSEALKLMKDMLEYIDVVMDGCKALERSLYGLMQMAQLDLKLSGMGHA